MTINLGIRLWTDFTSHTEAGENVSVIGVGGGSPVAPDAGDIVTLFDGEGHTCEAWVSRVVPQGPYLLVYSHAEPSTWKDEGEVTLTSDLLDWAAATVRRSSPETVSGSRERVDFAGATG